MRNHQTIRIVIAFDSFPAALRAKELAERVAPQLESEWDAWPFQLLAEPQAREYSLGAVSEAKLVIIAARGREDLPNGVKAWIEGWLEQKRNRPSTLVALLDENLTTLDRESGPCTYLQQVAERGTMDFFCNLWLQEDRVRTSSGIRASIASELIPNLLAAQGGVLNFNIGDYRETTTTKGINDEG